MKNWLLVKGIIVVFVILFSGIFVFYNKLYYPSLPMANVSQKKAIEKLNDSDNGIAKLTSENGFDWYITYRSVAEADEKIKKMVSQNGWVFKEKEGAALFFEKQGDKLIVTTQMWTGKYVLVNIPYTFQN